MKLFPLTLLWVLAFACCSSTQGGSNLLTYETRDFVRFDANFVSANDQLLVTEWDAHMHGVGRLYGIGEHRPVVEASLDGLRMPQEREFLLVDQQHFALPQIGDQRARLAIAPGSNAHAGQSILDWLDAAGGLLNPTSFDASTNAAANLSCALGADGSCATWKTDGPPAFRASPEGAVDHERVRVSRVFCLNADGRQFVAIIGRDRDAPPDRRTVCEIYEAGGTQPINVLVFPNAGYPRFLAPAQPSGDMLVDVTPQFSGPGRNDVSSWIARRIYFEAGHWTSERAVLDASWPADFRLLALDRSTLWITAPSDGFQLKRVAWPMHVASIAYAPTPVQIPFTQFQRDVLRRGAMVFSPSRDHLLWLDLPNVQALRIEVTRTPEAMR